MVIHRLHTLIASVLCALLLMPVLSLAQARKAQEPPQSTSAAQPQTQSATLKNVLGPPRQLDSICNTALSTAHTPVSVDEEMDQDTERMPDCDYDLGAFLRNNLRYPIQARKKNIQGVIYISMVACPDGYLRGHKALNSLGYGLDEEAMRVAELLPPLIPGIKGGRPVAVQLTQPIRFRLD